MNNLYNHFARFANSILNAEDATASTKSVEYRRYMIESILHSSAEAHAEEIGISYEEWMDIHNSFATISAIAVAL